MTKNIFRFVTLFTINSIKMDEIDVDSSAGVNAE